jgi:poly-gamma-glutamate capsule biosynthesis protein CapA/YwtB (metallophosphatase superfamily)
VDTEQVRFARRLVAGGVDLVHGHSWHHHAGPVEVFGGKLVGYGCGDCINDYEGITGHQEYRAGLRPLYFASLQPGTGTLAALGLRQLIAQEAAPWIQGALRTPV